MTGITFAERVAAVVARIERTIAALDPASDAKAGVFHPEDFIFARRWERHSEKPSRGMIEGIKAQIRLLELMLGDSTGEECLKPGGWLRLAALGMIFGPGLVLVYVIWFLIIP